MSQSKRWNSKAAKNFAKLCRKKTKRSKWNHETSTHRDILYRESQNCHYCGKPLTLEEVTLDHVLPLAKGGPDSLSNKVIACKECNDAKGDKTLEEFKAIYGSILGNMKDKHQ